jgi:hypothetical protein
MLSMQRDFRIEYGATGPQAIRYCDTFHGKLGRRDPWAWSRIRPAVVLSVAGGEEARSSLVKLLPVDSGHSTLRELTPVIQLQPIMLIQVSPHQPT